MTTLDREANANGFTATEDCFLLYFGYKNGLQQAPNEIRLLTGSRREGKEYNTRIGELNGTALSLGLGKTYDTSLSRWDVGAVHRVIQYMTKGNNATTASMAARVLDPVVGLGVLVRNRPCLPLSHMLIDRNSNSSTNRLLLGEHDISVPGLPYIISMASASLLAITLFVRATTSSRSFPISTFTN